MKNTKTEMTNTLKGIDNRLVNKEEWIRRQNSYHPIRKENLKNLIMR